MNIKTHNYIAVKNQIPEIEIQAENRMAKMSKSSAAYDLKYARYTIPCLLYEYSYILNHIRKY